jgi:hypothetical protein
MFLSLESFRKHHLPPTTDWFNLSRLVTRAERLENFHFVMILRLKWPFQRFFHRFARVLLHFQEESRCDKSKLVGVRLESGDECP